MDIIQRKMLTFIVTFKKYFALKAHIQWINYQSTKMKFSHLHVHTQFSLLDGAASIPSLYKKAIEDGMPALAISDHGNMFGVFEFVSQAYKHLDENGKPKIKPIVGCEFYITTDRHRKSFSKDEKDPRFHQILLAKNEIGYRNLIKLSSLGYTEGLYSKYPRIDKELVEKYHEGLIATTCCLGAMVPQAILKKVKTMQKKNSNGGLICLEMIIM